MTNTPQVPLHTIGHGILPVCVVMAWFPSVEMKVISMTWRHRDGVFVSRRHSPQQFLFLLHLFDLNRIEPGS